MSDRREFLKVSLAAAAGMAAAHVLPASAESAPLPDGIVYSAEKPGKWSDKVKSHAPVATVNGNKVSVKTEHSMSEEHYIVRHTLVSKTGEVLGEKTFHPSDKEAVSVFEIPAGHTALFATSFCNRHDFWVTAFTI